MASLLAFSADGRRIFTCGMGRVVREWDAATGQMRRVHTLPGPLTICACFSPDATLLAVSEWPDSWSLWETATGKVRRQVTPGDCGPVLCAAVAPNGQTLAAAEVSHGVSFWDLATGKKRLFKEVRGLGYSLVFTPDSKRLVAAFNDRTIRCWQTADGKEVWTIRSRAQDLALAPDGRTLVSVDEDGIGLWDMATGQPARQPRPALGDALPYSARFSPDGKTLAVSTSEGLVLWDLAAGKQRHKLRGTPSFAIAPDGKTLATLTHTLQLWDLATGQPLYPETRNRGHIAPVVAVACSPDGKQWASASLDGTIHVWERTTSRLLHTLPGPKGPNQIFLAFLPDSKQLLVAGDETAHFWDTITAKEVRRWPLLPQARGQRETRAGLHLTGDGKTLVTVSSGPLPDSPKHEGVVTRWDVATGKQVSRLPLSTGVYPNAISPDGRLIATGDGHLHDTTTGKVYLSLNAEHRLLALPGKGFAFSPDGALVAAVVERTVRMPVDWGPPVEGIQVWELASGKSVVQLPVRDVVHFAFAPDSGTLATAGGEAIRLWEIANGQEVCCQPVPERLLGWYGCPFVFAPDGRSLATGLENTTVLVWDLPPPASPRRPPLSTAQMNGLWADLAAAEASRAYAAIGQLVSQPAQALPLLRERLRPAAAIPAEQMKRLLADLDSSEFSHREEASKGLADLGEQARPALEAALSKQPSLDLRRRIEALLEPSTVRTSEELRGIRAVHVLEQIGTAEARQVLQKLADGTPEARLTKEAKASLERLARRPPVQP
jgi:WD40 repeat protein